MGFLIKMLYNSLRESMTSYLPVSSVRCVRIAPTVSKSWFLPDIPNSRLGNRKPLVDRSLRSRLGERTDLADEPCIDPKLMGRPRREKLKCQIESL